MAKIYHKLKDEITYFWQLNVPLYAANTAFYVILSVFPAIMLAVGLLPYIGFEREDLLSAMKGVVPTVLEPLLSKVVYDMSENSSRALISVTAIIAIWSSSRGVGCIQQGFHFISGIRDHRNYFLRRFICMVYMVLFLIALMLTLVIQGFGRELTAFLLKQNVPVFRFIAKLLDFRELIVLVILTFFFTLIFCFLPYGRHRLKYMLPCAALTALGWQLFTYFFSIYARMSGSYSVLYGSLSIIAIGMLWLFICLCILFYGYAMGIRLSQKKNEPQN